MMCILTVYSFAKRIRKQKNIQKVRFCGNGPSSGNTSTEWVKIYEIRDGKTTCATRPWKRIIYYFLLGKSISLLI